MYAIVKTHMHVNYIFLPILVINESDLFWEANMRIYEGLLFIRTLHLALFARYSASKISISDPDLSWSPKVKYFNFVGKPIRDFIMVFYWYELLLSRNVCEIFRILKFRLVTLIFQGHRMSNITFWKAHMWLYTGVCWYELSISHHLRGIRLPKFQVMTFHF